jgi:hypothetical protein
VKPLDRAQGGLGDAARHRRDRRREDGKSAYATAAHRLVGWVTSRPDQLSPLPLAGLDLARRHPTGLPVLVANETGSTEQRWIAPRWSGLADPERWIPPLDRLAATCPWNPVTAWLELFGFSGNELPSSEALLPAAEFTVVMAGASDSETSCLVHALQSVGRNDLVALVESFDLQGAPLDPSTAGRGCPCPWNLLQEAFSGDQHKGVRFLLDQFCSDAMRW